MPLISFHTSNPLIDGRQSDHAMLVRRGMTRHLEETGHCVLAEFPLANGRRADLIAMDRKGGFTIVEIKSSIEDYKADNKWPEYLAFCDTFVFATHSGVPAEIFPDEEGLYLADAHGAHMLREGRGEKLAAATRKALTLRFARLAALRLERVTQFSLASGLDMSGLDTGTGEGE